MGLMWDHREGPQAREPSKCLNGAGAARKTGQRGRLIASYKRHERRAITPAAEAARVPAHLAPPGSPKARQLHHLHAELPQAAETHLASILTGSLRSCPTLQPCRLWPARLLSQGVLQARILERIGQHWLPYPPRALYFLLP